MCVGLFNIYIIKFPGGKGLFFICWGRIHIRAMGQVLDVGRRKVCLFDWVFGSSVNYDVWSVLGNTGARGSDIAEWVTVSMFNSGFDILVVGLFMGCLKLAHANGAVCWECTRWGMGYCM